MAPSTRCFEGPTSLDLLGLIDSIAATQEYPPSRILLLAAARSQCDSSLINATIRASVFIRVDSTSQLTYHRVQVEEEHDQVETKLDE